MDVGKEDISMVGVSEEDAVERVRWRWRSCCGDPKREQPKAKDNAKDKKHIEVALQYMNIIPALSEEEKR